MPDPTVPNPTVPDPTVPDAATPGASYPSLRDRTVLVTGGGSGIGAAIVAAFARQGARTAFLDIDEAASTQLLAELAAAPDVAHAPLFIPCDLTDIAALRAAIDRVRAALGPIRVLVNNAANDDRHDPDAVTPEYWDRSLAVNLRHQFFAAQAVRPQMQALGGGSIINFSSIAWMGGGPDMAVYTTAKAGVVGMTNSLARAFGPDNIRVNAVAPGAVVTERQRRLWLSEADVSGFAARQCIRRSLLAPDIARTVLFLASDDSDMITKQCLTVDAGLR